MHGNKMLCSSVVMWCILYTSHLANSLSTYVASSRHDCGMSDPRLVKKKTEQKNQNKKVIVLLHVCGLAAVHRISSQQQQLDVIRNKNSSNEIICRKCSALISSVARSLIDGENNTIVSSPLASSLI